MTMTEGSDTPVDHVEWPPRFQFASRVWPGLAKLVEECGEVIQVCGKIVGTAGTMRFRGEQVVERFRLVNELADLDAVIGFIYSHALTPDERLTMLHRHDAKRELFERWRTAETCGDAS
jgi:hypothetical protein